MTSNRKFKIEDYFTEKHYDNESITSGSTISLEDEYPVTEQNNSINSIIPSVNYTSDSVYTGYNVYQQNIDEQSIILDDNLVVEYKILPLTFIMDYESVQKYENSKKIIAPKSLLYTLSRYENIEIPVFIKLGENDTLFGISEYHDFIEHIYIPTKTFYEYGLSENSIIPLTILKDRPINATSISIKPLHEAFYMVPDKKEYLEKYLKKYFISLTQDEIIRLPFADDFITIQIDKLEPRPVVSIYDLEEVSIIILPMIEPSLSHVEIEKEYIPNPTSTISNQPDISNLLGGSGINTRTNNTYTPSNIVTRSSNAFVPYSGNGHTLGKDDTKDKER